MANNRRNPSGGQDGPRAAPKCFPYKGHRTLAEVDRDEAEACNLDAHIANIRRFQEAEL